MSESRWSHWVDSTPKKKGFSAFLNEADQGGVNPTGNGIETPAEKATRLGLQSDGHGSYMDPQTGQIVARTVNNELVFYDNGPTGGAVSDGEGGSYTPEKPGSGGGNPSFRDPDTGAVVVPPARPENPEAKAAVPDHTPASAPAGYQDAMSAKKKKAQRKNDLVARMSAAFDKNVAPAEVDPMDSIEGRRGAVDAEIKSGTDGAAAHEKIHGHDPTDPESNAALAATMGRLGGDNGLPSIDPDKGSKSLFAQDKEASVEAETEEPTEEPQEDENPVMQGKSLDDFLKQIQKEPDAPKETQKAAKAAKKAIDNPTVKNVKAADKAVAKAGRRDSGNQFTELVVGAYLANPDIQSVQDVIDSPLPHENIARRDAFLGDLDNPVNSDKFVGDYIEGLRTAIGKKFGKIDPKSVYVRANNNDLAPEEIREQIKNLASGEHKADVMFTGEDGQHYGVGVKQTPNATLTNYSIESLFDSAFNTANSHRNDPNSRDYDPTLDSNSDQFNPDDDRLKSWGQRLREARETMYAEAGIPSNAAELRAKYPEARKKKGGFDWHHESVPSDLRDKYGELMVPDENAYHSTFREMMAENGEDFMKFVYKKLFPEALPYKLFNFNGTELEEFSKEGLIGNGKIDVIPTGNPAKKPTGAAKQFLTLMHDGKPKFQMETRHKGDPFSSQQLFTSKWDDAKHTHRPYETK